jgi:uncharacterized LabA/DUF88 family protein
MPYSPETTSMALFCDFENVALGVRESHHEKFDIKLVLERLLLKGSIVVKKAYCDWERYKSFKAPMHEASFELIEIPHVRQSGKNSADIRLVVDALDLCYTKAHVNTFVIISGDSDFSPLVSKLRENNKQVIGVGVKDSTSDLLTANCDEFIFYDDLVREGQRSRRAAPPPAPAHGRRGGGGAEDERRRDEAEARRAKGIDLAVQTLEALASERGDGGKIWASVLKEAIKRRKPDFSESYYGFRNFGSMLEEAQSRGLLEVGRDEKANAYVFRSALASQGSPALAALAAASTEGHAAARAPEEPMGELAREETHPERGDRVQRNERDRGERGERGGRGRGRRSAERHEFEPVVALDGALSHGAEAALEGAQSELPLAEEREAVAATLMEEPRARDEVVSEPLPSGESEQPSAEARARRGARGGRGGASRKKAPEDTPAEAAPAVEAAAPGSHGEGAEPAPAPAKAPKAAGKKTSSTRARRPRGAAAKKSAA